MIFSIMRVVSGIVIAVLIIGGAIGTIKSVGKD